MSVKFQYLSDLHLEFYNENLNKIQKLFCIKNATANILLLAGDIGKPTHKSYILFEYGFTNIRQSNHYMWQP